MDMLNVLILFKTYLFSHKDNDLIFHTMIIHTLHPLLIVTS